MVFRMTEDEWDAMRARRTKREKMSDRARKRTEPHWAHPLDIEAVANDIAGRWFRRAVRFGDELPFLNHLYAIPDPRS